MKCNMCINRMSSYYENALKEDERQELEEHLGTCTYCQDEWKKLKIILDELKQLDEVSLPTNFHEIVMKRVYEEESKKTQATLKPLSKIKRTSWLKTGGGLVAVLVLAIGLFNYDFSFTNEKGAASASTESMKQQMATPAPKEEEIERPMARGIIASKESQENGTEEKLEDNRLFHVAESEELAHQAYLQEEWQILTPHPLEVLERLKNYSMEQGYEWLSEEENERGETVVLLQGSINKEDLKAFFEKEGCELQEIVETSEGEAIRLTLRQE